MSICNGVAENLELSRQNQLVQFLDKVIRSPSPLILYLIPHAVSVSILRQRIHDALATGKNSLWQWELGPLLPTAFGCEVKPSSLSCPLIVPCEILTSFFISPLILYLIQLLQSQESHNYTVTVLCSYSVQAWNNFGPSCYY